MARIRCIKPELPQSESMGKVSRNARLLFILMWTLADDEGRLRGNSRMLASLLFPYDDDAPGLIDGWLFELIEEKCIVIYQVENATYVQIANWLIHQKIDKPSRSKIPEFGEASRILANRRGGIKDQGSEDQGSKEGTEEPHEAAENRRRTVTAADLSVAMRKAGVQSQPADPRLIALASQGVLPGTMTAACDEAKRAKPGQRVGPAYVFAILERWAAEAAALNAAGASAPKSAGGAWWTSDASIIAKGSELGLTPLPGESMPTFKGRIEAAIANGGKPPAPRPTAPAAAPPSAPKSVKPEGVDLLALVGRGAPKARAK